MKKAFPDTIADGKNETRPKGASNANEPLDITRTLEVQAMPLEANISPFGDSTTSYDIEILEQYLPLSAFICPDVSQEGHALWKLMALLDNGVEPGVVLVLARYCDDTKTFNAIATELQAAMSYPSEAERFAARAMEHGRTPHAQDCIFRTVMFAAARSAAPNDEWQSLHSVTKRVVEKVDRGRE